jgi:hypothetical protein
MSDLTVTINPPQTTSISIRDGILPHNLSHAPSGSDSLSAWYASVESLQYVSGQIGAPAGVVLITGDQNISGIKNFYSRPTVNGSGVMLDGEVASTGYLTGYVQKTETGSFVTSGNTGNFVTTSQTGRFTGAFYPYTGNPSAFIQGAVVRPSNTGNFVDLGSNQTISGQKTFTKTVIAPTGFFGEYNTSGEFEGQTMAGGMYNHVEGVSASVLGGYSNSVSGNYSCVAGGSANNVSGITSAILGGGANVVESGNSLIVVGGENNRIINSNISTNIGGSANLIHSSSYSSLIGGISNTISGGYGNFSIGDSNFIRESDQCVAIGFNHDINYSTGVFVVGRQTAVGGVENAMILCSTSSASSGSHTAVINYASGIFLDAPTYFQTRPTVNGSGVMLSGEAAGTGYLTGYVQKSQTGTFAPLNDSITGIAVDGSSTKTITLYQYDGTTLTASFTDQQGTGGAGSDYYIYSGSFDSSNGNLTLNRTGDSGSVVIALDGRYATGSVVRPSETGGFVTTGQTGVFYPISNPSGFVTGVDLSSYATTTFVTGISGYQAGLISSLQSSTGNLNTRVATIEGITGNFALSNNTGAFLTTGAADSRYTLQSATGVFVTTGQTGAFAASALTGAFLTTGQTGVFYPTSNPSGFITGVDLSAYATTAYVTGVSGYQAGLISSLQSSTGNLNTRVSTIEGVTGGFALSNNTGAFLTTGAGDNRYALQSATGAFLITGAADLRYIGLTGDQTVSGIKNFASRPTVNGSGVMLTGEAAANNTGYLTGYVNKTETGVFAASALTGAFLTTGAADARYIRQPYVAEIYIDAGAMLTGLSGASPVTSAVNSISYDGYDFDAATTGYSQFKVTLADYDLGAIKTKFRWTSASTGSVVWGVQAYGAGDGESINPTWSVAQEVTDTYVTGSGIHISAATSSFVPSGSVQSGDSLFFRLYRNASSASDTISTNATLLGVSVQYTGTSITAW